MVRRMWMNQNTFLDLKSQNFRATLEFLWGSAKKIIGEGEYGYYCNNFCHGPWNNFGHATLHSAMSSVICLTIYFVTHCTQKLHSVTVTDNAPSSVTRFTSYLFFWSFLPDLQEIIIFIIIALNGFLKTGKITIKYITNSLHPVLNKNHILIILIKVAYANSL